MQQEHEEQSQPSSKAAAQQLHEFREDLPLLIEAGFIAVKQLDEVNSTRIFHAAQAIAPDSTAPQIGLGFIALNKLEIKQATQIFETVLAKEPENYLAQTFLGICFLLSKQKRPKGEKLVREAMNKTDDPTIKDLGKVSLEWAEKDLKKAKAPFLVEKEGEGDEGHQASGAPQKTKE